MRGLSRAPGRSTVFRNKTVLGGSRANSERQCRQGRWPELVEKLLRGLERIFPGDQLPAHAIFVSVAYNEVLEWIHLAYPKLRSVVTVFFTVSFPNLKKSSETNHFQGICVINDPLGRTHSRLKFVLFSEIWKNSDTMCKNNHYGYMGRPRGSILVKTAGLS